jgi:hypothetical protein
MGDNRTMRQATAFALTVLALGCTTSIAAGAPDSTARPTLKLVNRDPLTVRGTQFQARERVRVAAAGRHWRLRANVQGRFVLVLGGIDRCDTVRVVAVGNEGSRTILKILPSPLCAPS